MRVTKHDRKTNLEKEIDRVLLLMSVLKPESKEYSTMVDNLKELYKVNIEGKEKDRSIKPDTIALIAGNLLGIGLILGYEKTNVITTKALGFIMKGRVH